MSPGVKMVRMEVPIYETRQVKVGLRGIKQQVPVYETKKVLIGYRREIQQVLVYETKKILTGTRWVEKKIPVKSYRTEKVWNWQKTIQRAPVTRWIWGKKLVVGYKNQTCWRKAQTTQIVPYKTTKNILVKEPVYTFKRVQTGTRAVPRWVPKYKEKQILVDYQTVQHTVPVFEEQKVQVGTRIVNRLVTDTVEEVNDQQVEGTREGGILVAGTKDKLAGEIKLLEKLIPNPGIQADPEREYRLLPRKDDPRYYAGTIFIPIIQDPSQTALIRIVIYGKRMINNHVSDITVAGYKDIWIYPK